MKKTLIFLFSIVVLIALLPLIGNKLIEQELDNKLEVLISYGVEVKNTTTDRSYLSTQKHYELSVIDSDKFQTYLQNFTSSHVPTYVNTFIDGTTMGIDIKYSNFPLSDALSVDIYPLALSEKNINLIAKKDSKFALYIKNMLENKTILYHINYNIIKSEFNGFVKDIDENYTIKDGRKIIFNLKGFKFSGDGLLMAPDRINSQTKEFSIYISEPNEKISVVFKDLSSTSNFESTSTYLYGGEIKSFDFKLNNIDNDNISLNLQKLHLNVASNTQAKKAEFSTKTSFDSFEMNTKNKNTKLNGFNYDLFIKDLDKDSFEKLSVILAQTNSLQPEELNSELSNAIMKILANGLAITLADFSVKKIDYLDEKGMDGFSVKTNLVITKDEILLQNSNKISNSAVDNIALDSSMKISKKLFLAIKKEFPLLMLVEAYAKDSAEFLVYDTEIKDNKFIVNGKQLR